MAMKITNCYVERLPNLRLIGKSYKPSEMVNGFFGPQWQEWLSNGWFCHLYSINEPAEEANRGPLGLVIVNDKDKSDFIYWIGILFPPGTPAPKGFSYIDLPSSRVGIVWVYGNDNANEIIGKDVVVAAHKHLESKNVGNLSRAALGPDTVVFFERYNCPRFTNPDEKGNIILDYGFYLDR